MPTIQVPARHYRLFNFEGVPNDEHHLGYEEATLPLPLEETALVLVDTWNDHPTEGWVQRAAKCMDEKIVPLLEAVRGSDMTVIHAPSKHVAVYYPQWVRYASGEDLDLIPPPPSRPEPDWPPAEFRNREGKYSIFKHRQPQELARPTGIYGPAEPLPHEYVVGTREQMHRLLTHQKILYLIYAGFASNMCLQDKPCAIKAMNGLGYACIVLADCGIAYESHDTVEEELQHKVAIRDIEAEMGWSSTLKEFLDALRTTQEVTCCST